MIKLAVFDVDGTLVTKGNRRVPASCVHALNELSRKGVKLAIASGRPPFAMEQSLLEQVSFDYFVCSNGAFVRMHSMRCSIITALPWRKHEA